MIGQCIAEPNQKFSELSQAVLAPEVWLELEPNQNSLTNNVLLNSSLTVTIQIESLSHLLLSTNSLLICYEQLNSTESMWLALQALDWLMWQISLYV